MGASVKTTTGGCLCGALLLLASCTSMPEQACGGNQHAAIQDSLYFGTAKPAGTVSADEWKRFVDAEVTPRFPQGLTVWQGDGQWQGAGGKIVREPSYVLTLVHPDDQANENGVRDVCNAYKAQFQQEAVLRVKARVCISF